jgi:hypothetical protein
MKTTALILLSYFAILGPAQAQPLDASTLSLHPRVACKGAGRPAPRTRDTVHAEIPDHPLEIFVCAPWVTEAIHHTEHDGAGIKTFLNGRDDL